MRKKVLKVTCVLGFLCGVFIYNQNKEYFYKIKECGFQDIGNCGWPSDCHYICHEFKGQLGNQLFQYASIYGLSRERGLRMVVPGDMLLRTFMKIETGFTIDTCVCKYAKVIHEGPCCSLDPNITRVWNDMDYVIDGFLQTWRYFFHYEDELRQQFQFLDEVLHKATSVLQSALTKKFVQYNRKLMTLVGVHVRRGDMLTPDSVRFGYKIAPPEYLTKAQHYFRRKYKNVTFVVFSDEFNWTKTIVDVKYNDVIFMEGNSAVTDLALLSILDHTIMTIGSYGWWAGFLCHGETVYYKNFTTPGTAHSKGYGQHQRDFVYPTWVGL